MPNFTLGAHFKKMAKINIERSTVSGPYIVQYPRSKRIKMLIFAILEKSLLKVKRSMKFYH